MRCDRYLPVAAMLVLFCCASGAVAAHSITSHQVLVAAVVANAHMSDTEERMSVRVQLDRPVIQFEIDNCIPLQIEINKFHNLPPPVGV